MFGPEPRADSCDQPVIESSDSRVLPSLSVFNKSLHLISGTGLLVTAIVVVLLPPWYAIKPQWIC